YQEHARWAVRHEAPLAGEIRPHANDRSESRRLRIGYISADFFQHSVSYFLEPILARHDRSGFEIHCFADELVTDQTTGRLRSYADHWHAITAMTDAQVAQLVREMQIDILVDL